MTAMAPPCRPLIGAIERTRWSDAVLPSVVPSGGQ
jgi:hypothetical protein